MGPLQRPDALTGVRSPLSQVLPPAPAAPDPRFVREQAHKRPLHRVIKRHATSLGPYQRYRPNNDSDASKFFGGCPPTACELRAVPGFSDGGAECARGPGTYAAVRDRGAHFFDGIARH